MTEFSSTSTLSSETEPLLASVALGAKDSSSGVKLTVCLFVESAPGERRLKPEKTIIRLNFISLSVILSYVLQNSIQTAAVLIAGRLGPDALSVAAFSYMLAFVTGEFLFY